MSPLQRRQDFDPAGFLKEFWQQKPLLIPGFVENFSDPLSAEELAGLACEEEVESRLVSHFPGQDWCLEHGPFPEARFPDLPRSHWTLLVQAVDQHWPEVSRLLKLFDFLPNWRLDDVMVSFAAEAGGVGPHFDQYDVFLVQGAGSRRWQLGPRCNSGTPVADQAGLSVLTRFTPRQEYLLHTGDVLYVPAGYAHNGVAAEAGLCYSIGFRAPALTELVDEVADLLIRQGDESERFTDPCGTAYSQPGEIPLSALQPLQQQLQQQIADPLLFGRAFAQSVTYPRYPELLETPSQPYDFEGLSSLLEQRPEIKRAPGARFAWLALPDKQALWLFSCGECFTLSADERAVLVQLCDLTIENLIETFRGASEQGRQLALQLLNQGSLVAG